MKLEAYAKINLGLKVVGKTSEGYHLLDMVMLPISLCDYIEITKREPRLITRRGFYFLQYKILLELLRMLLWNILRWNCISIL